MSVPSRARVKKLSEMSSQNLLAALHDGGGQCINDVCLADVEALERRVCGWQRTGYLDTATGASCPVATPLLRAWHATEKNLH